MADERLTEQKRSIKLSDGKDYDIKPLSLLDTKKLLPILNELDKLRSSDGINDRLIELMADVCHEILKRSNPNLTREKVLELVELESVFNIILLGVGKILK